MAVELATAYVSIVPETSKLAPALRKELNGSAVMGAADKGGQSMGSRLMAGAGKTLKRTAVGVGVAAGAALGLSIAKGIGRLTSIEDAEAKLLGLGNSTEAVAAIMENANDSVTGTAFSLAEAATTAATAVAAGVKPGQELAKYLTLTADAASIAGVSLDEMGSVLNNVQTVGAAYNDSLRILAQKGIPIYSMLSKELGITSAEVKDLASEGKISADVLNDVLGKKVGGAALEAGNTTTGAFKNMNAAIARFGAGLIQGVFPIAKTVFNGIGKLLDDTRKAITPFIEDFSAKIGPAFSRIAEAVGPAALAVGSFVTMLTTNVLPIIQRIAESVATNFGPVFASLSDTFTTRILPGLQTLGGYISTNLMPVFREWGAVLANDIIPTVASVAQWFADKLLPAILDIAGKIAKNVKPVFDQFVATLRNDVIPFVKDLIFKFNQARPALEMVAEKVVWVAGKFLEFYTALQGKVLPVIARVVGFLLRRLVPALSRVAEMSLNAAADVLRAFRRIASGVTTAILAIIDPLEKVARAMKLPWNEELTKAKGELENFQDNTLAQMDGWADSLSAAAAIAGSGISSGIANGFGQVDLVATIKKLPKNQQVAAALGVPLPPDISYTMKKTGGGGGGGSTGGLTGGTVSGGGSSAGGGGGGGGGGASGGLSKAQEKAKKLRDDLLSFIRGDLVRSITGGTEAQINKVIDKLVTKVEGVFDGKKEKRLVGRLERQRKILTADARARVKIAQDLKDAEDTLEKSKNLTASVKSSAIGGLGQLSSAGEVKGYLTQRLAQIKSFGANLSTLAKRGLPAFFLQQIIDEGLGGAPLAAALASSSGADFSAIVSGANQLETAAGGLGETASVAMFGVGSDAAQGIVDGFKSKDKELKAAMLSTAKKMRKAIRKALGIKSPSRVMAHDVGEPIADGVAVGIEAGQDRVDSAMGSLVTTPRIGTPQIGGIAARDAGSLDDLATEVRALAVAVASRPVVLEADKREFARVLDAVDTRSDRMVRGR